MIIDTEKLFPHFARQVAHVATWDTEVKELQSTGNCKYFPQCPRFGTTSECTFGNCHKCEHRLKLVIDSVDKLLDQYIPKSKHFVNMLDEDDPSIGYIGDGFMNDKELEDLKLPEKITDNFIELYDFEKYVDTGFVPDPNYPNEENVCLKFKIKPV